LLEHRPAVVRVGERELQAQGGARNGRAVKKDLPAERLHAVLEPAQSDAAGQVRAPAPIVADLDPQHVVAVPPTASTWI
jgi:hypothetical protein